MASLTKAIHDLLTTANPKKIVETIEAVSPEVQAKMEVALRQATLDTLTVCRIVCRGILAERLGVHPTSDQVNDFMLKAADDPKFAHRAFRHFGEAQKSSDRRRRLFLASILYGLPFSKMPDDDRDRVDMVAERLVPEDLLLLAEIDQKNRTTAPPVWKEPPVRFDESQVAALIYGVDVRIATTDDYRDDENNRGFDGPVFVEERFRVDQAAFSSLVSLGCLDIGQSESSQGPWKIHTVLITRLGHLMLQAIEEVRAGFAA